MTKPDCKECWYYDPSIERIAKRCTRPEEEECAQIKLEGEIADALTAAFKEAGIIKSSHRMIR